MTMRLDRQIEQLERIVERRLELCKATWNGMPCRLPANHEPTEPHKFCSEAADAELPASPMLGLGWPPYF